MKRIGGFPKSPVDAWPHKTQIYPKHQSTVPPCAATIIWGAVGSACQLHALSCFLRWGAGAGEKWNPAIISTSSSQSMLIDAETRPEKPLHRVQRQKRKLNPGRARCDWAHSRPEQAADLFAPPQLAPRPPRGCCPGSISNQGRGRNRQGP